MKNLRLLFLFPALIGGMVQGQEPVPVVQAPPAVLRRTPQEIEQLVAPVALYPDALLALILPAATAPTDVVLAARHVREFPGDLSQVEHRAWDESVKSLTHYPEVLTWMDENLPWTKQVGEAFAVQPADVMQAVQRLRAKARAAGTLVDTPQQQVVADADVLRIVPAQPDVIYVPYYAPETVFIDRPVYFSSSFITFGAGVAVGSWLAFDCDWRRHSVWVGNRHRPWTGHDWRRPMVPIATASVMYSRSPDVRQWRPPPPRPHAATAVGWRPPLAVVRPSPIRPIPRQGPAPSSQFADRRPDVSNPPPRPPTSTRPTFTGSRNGTLGLPRGTTPRQVVSPAVPMTSAPLPPEPAASVSPPPPIRKHTARPDGNSDRESRPRPTSAPGHRVAPPAGTFNAPPPAPPAPRAAPAAPDQNRVYSRGSRPSDARPAPPAAAPPRSPAITPPPATAAAPATPPPARVDNNDGRRGGRRNENEHER